MVLQARLDVHVLLYYTNIAEGCGRNSDAELARILEIAMGSASELEYILLLTHGLKLFNAADYHRLSNDVTEVKKNACIIYH